MPWSSPVWKTALEMDSLSHSDRNATDSVHVSGGEQPKLRSFKLDELAQDLYILFGVLAGTLGVDGRDFPTSHHPLPWTHPNYILGRVIGLADKYDLPRVD